MHAHSCGEWVQKEPGLSQRGALQEKHTASLQLAGHLGVSKRQPQASGRAWMARHHAHAVYTTCNLPQQPNSNWLEVRHQRRQRNVHAKHDATLMPSLITRRRVMSDTGQQLTSRQATTMEPWPAAAAASNSRNPFVHKGPAACTLYNTPTGGFTCSNAHDPCNTHTHARILPL